jgi:hypothetical protein
VADDIPDQLDKPEVAKAKTLQNLQAQGFPVSDQ